MGRPKRASAQVASSAKRTKLVVGAGEKLVVAHAAPRAKRIFADLCGTVVATTESTAELRFKVPKSSLALYSDYIDADGEEATVKFALSHVARMIAPTAKSPFYLASVQEHLAGLLCPKSLLHFARTARGSVSKSSLARCLTASLRRALLRAPSMTTKEFRLLRQDWAGYKQGTFLKRHAYADVKQLLLKHLVAKKPGGDCINETAMALVETVGARYDAELIHALMQIKSALARQKYCELACDAQLRFLIGDKGRGKQQQRSVFAVTVLLRAFASSPGSTSSPWLHSLLIGIGRGSMYKEALQRACYQPSVDTALMCLDRIADFPKPVLAIKYIAHLLAGLGCNEAVFAKLNVDYRISVQSLERRAICARKSNRRCLGPHFLCLRS